MLQDTLEFAVRMLVPNGRLSMWMPTANDDDVELAIPNSPGLELVSVCVQTFNKCRSGIVDVALFLMLKFNRVPTATDLSSSRTRPSRGCNI